MRIAESTGSVPVRLGRAVANPANERDEAASPAASTALIPVQRASGAERPAVMARRPLGAFLAHLIATHAQVPQTRERRRAEPEEAVAAYAAMPAAIPAAKGRVLARRI